MRPHEPIEVPAGFEIVANEKRFHRTVLIGFGLCAALFLLVLFTVITPKRVSLVVVDVAVVASRDGAGALVNDDYEPEIRGAMVRLRFDADIELERYGKGTGARLHFSLIPAGQERTAHTMWSGPIRHLQSAKARRYEVYVPVDIDDLIEHADGVAPKGYVLSTRSRPLELRVGLGSMIGMVLEGAVPVPLVLRRDRLIISR